MAKKAAMTGNMATLRMSNSDFIKDFAAMLAETRKGAEVVIEQDDLPVALIRPMTPRGRLLSECIAIAEVRASEATLDDGFMQDVEEGIASRSLPWNPPSWE